MHKVSFQQLAQGFLAEKGFEGHMFFPQNSFSYLEHLRGSKWMVRGAH